MSHNGGIGEFPLISLGQNGLNAGPFCFYPNLGWARTTRPYLGYCGGLLALQEAATGEFIGLK